MKGNENTDASYISGSVNSNGRTAQGRLPGSVNYSPENFDVREPVTAIANQVNHIPDAGYDAGTLDAGDHPDGSTPDAGTPDAGTGCQNPVRWYNDGDRDNHRSATNFVVGCGPSDTFTLPETAPIDCDDAVPGCNTDCTSVLYINNDRDSARGAQSRRGCDAPELYNLPFTAPIDCDDNDNSTFQYLQGARDVDNDTFTAGALESVCSGTGLPVGWRLARSAQDDCDDAVPSCNVDCVTLQYINSDNDVARGAQSRRGCDAPALYNLPFTAPIDCDDNDNSTFQYLQGARDVDNDTFTVGALESVCSGTGLPAGWRSARSAPEDCDDTVALCNTDCVTLVYGDLDEDGARNVASYRACDTPPDSVVPETAPIDCDDLIASCTTDCVTMQYIDVDHDNFRGVESHRVCDASVDYSLTAAAPLDCDEAVASCTDDCTTLMYINTDGDNFRGRASHRSCDASAEYTLSVSASIDCNDAVFNATLEDVLACGINGRGTQARRCVDGTYQVDPCAEVDDCLDGSSRSVTCSQNVSICRQGNETELCSYDAGSDKFRWQLQGDCDGILPQLEDPGDVPTLIDEDCNNIPIRTHLIPTGLVYVGCDNNLVPNRCNVDNTPMHPAELPVLRRGATILYRVITEEIPLLFYRQGVDNGWTTAPATQSSRLDPNYYNNPDKINGGWPVVAITWAQARQFCVGLGGNAAQLAQVQADPYIHQRMDGDLPTEAEFLMAARGSYAERNAVGEIISTGNPLANANYAWGNDDPTCILANFTAESGFCVGDLVSAYANPAGAGYSGALNLNGNGWEWVFNAQQNYVASNDPEYDPMGPVGDATSPRVMMGGGFQHRINVILSSNRLFDSPTTTNTSKSFRCVIRTPYEP